MQSRRTMVRSTSVPKLEKMSTPSALKQNSVKISAYFEPQLAEGLTQSLAQGFAQSTPSNHPNLTKSHSGFASNEVPVDLRKVKSAPATSPSSQSPANVDEVKYIPDHNTQSTQSSVKFDIEADTPTSGQTVSLRTPTSPDNAADNQPSNAVHFGQYPVQENVPSNISNADSSGPQSHLDSLFTHSFSINKNGATMRLDLSEIGFGNDSNDLFDTFRGPSFRIDLLENQDSLQSNDFLIGSGPSAVPQSNQLATVLSQESTDDFDDKKDSKNKADIDTKHRSPQSPVPPGVSDNASFSDRAPRRVSSLYSNNSLFTLRSSDLSSADDLLAKNTSLNAQTSSSRSPVTDSKEIDVLDLKEDFMECHVETGDTFNSIGSGASGIVRKAFHFRSCKLVAIKQCRSKVKREEGAFIREARLYKQFEHNPHIPDILGFGKDANNGFLMMCLEFMDLMSCDTLQIHSDDRISMEAKELAVGHIMYGTLCALDDLHRDLYVHNDIKPANILANHFGEIKLSDLGTVLQLKEKKKLLTRNNGTQRYQAPEKIMGSKGVKYNTKSGMLLNVKGCDV